MITISAVIPTRNRAQHLNRLLLSLSKQTLGVQQVIIVDASDDYSYQPEFSSRFENLSLIWQASSASVCHQRNVGIGMASGEWIFLCDDDIELPPDHIETLARYIDIHPECGVVAGRLLQLENGRWESQYPVLTFRDLLWRFFFQQSIWGNIDSVRIPPWAKFIGRRVVGSYRRRGNSTTAGGWPLVTEWKEPVFHTKFYSLGANLVRREWLVRSPYDEVLDANGIGDHYGVAMDFPGSHSIHVLSTTAAFHHRAEENRQRKPVSYFQRVLALHYFQKKKGIRLSTTAALIWSLVGNAMHSFIRLDWPMMRASTKAIITIVAGANPYWIAHQKLRQPSSF